MNEKKLNDDFIKTLQGERIKSMDPEWKLIGRMIRNFLLRQQNEEEVILEKNSRILKERIRKELEDKRLIGNSRKINFKNWLIAILLGTGVVYATKDLIYYSKPIPIELKSSQTKEENGDQDPRLFWKKWFNGGTFIMFGSQRTLEALPTNFSGCTPDNISLKGCLNLYKDHPYNAKLLFNIGLMYELENNDTQKAIEFYKKSAALGNHRALNNYNYLIEKN
jgi:hypothetical protein